jgi:hypothetical protein
MLRLEHLRLLTEQHKNGDQKKEGGDFKAARGLTLRRLKVLTANEGAVLDPSRLQATGGGIGTRVFQA